MSGALRTGGHLLVVVLQVAVMFGLAPLVVVITRQVRARLEGRAGAGLLQPWRDVRKLLGKRPVHAAGTSVVTRAARVSSDTNRAMPKSRTFTVKGTPRLRDTAMYTLSGLMSE